MQLMDIRLRYFKHETKDLYRRYQQLLIIFVSLFGLMLVERPDMPARPILNFADAPLDTLKNTLLVMLWVSFVGLWTYMHRMAIQGADLSRYALTFPISKSRLKLIDLSVLLVSFGVFFVLFGFSIYWAVRADRPWGLDGRFVGYWFSMLCLSLAVAKTVAYGSSTRRKLLQILAWTILLASPHAMSGFTWYAAIVMCNVVAIACLLSDDQSWIDNTKPVSVRTPNHPLLSMAWFYVKLLFQQYRPLSFGRMAWAALPLVFVWWLITVAGNVRDAHLLTHLAFGTAAGLLSGLHAVFLSANDVMLRHLRSTSHGVWIVDGLSQLLVLVVGGVVFAGFSGVLTLTTPVFVWQYLLQMSLYYLGLLLLLRATCFHVSETSVFLKFGACVCAMLLGGQLICL